LSRSGDYWQDYGVYLAFGAALAALLGSLYYSEIAGFVPCRLCWYQRILMYPLVPILLVGIVRQDKGLPAYALPLSLTGVGLSAYHYLMQLGVVGHTTACSVGTPCDLRWVNYGGFVTIPLLALTAFILISGSLALSWLAVRRESQQARATSTSTGS
jgi:disulfide bond formation protein DsbB